MTTRTNQEPRERRIELPGRGGVMAALEFGPTDRPIDVIFAHANGFNARTYCAMLEPLTTLRILAVDQRGHGFTELPTVTEGRTSWDDMVQDHLALLDALDIDEVVLAGHSMGASVSLMAAGRAPKKVRSVVMFDPVILSRSMLKAAAEGELTRSPIVAVAAKRRAIFPSRDAAFESYVGKGAFKTWPDNILADYVAGGFKDRPDGQVELACAPSWESSDFASQLNDCWRAFADSHCPVSILLGEKGSPAWLKADMPTVNQDGRIGVQTIAGTTHFLPMERPDLVQAALLAASAR